MIGIIKLYNGVKMPIMGLGTSNLFGDVLVRMVEEARNNGVTMYDTAYIYNNERDLSIAFSKNNIERSDIFLTSKLSSVEYLGRRRFFYLDKKSVSKSLSNTLKRLNTEYLDLYMLHSLEFANWDKALQELFQEYYIKRIKAVGVCNITLEKLVNLVDKQNLKPMVIQVEITPYYVKKELVDYCHQNNIAVVAHSQFAKGNPLLMENPILKKIAKKYDKTLQQIILKWLNQRQIIVIPRTSKPQNLKSNMKIFDFELSDEDMNEINSINKNFSFSRP